MSSEMLELDDEWDWPEETEKRSSKEDGRPLSPIVFASAGNLYGAEFGDLDMEGSIPNFWASLERLERLHGKGEYQADLPLCPSEDSRFRPTKKTLTETFFRALPPKRYSLEEDSLDRFIAPVTQVVQSAAIREAMSRVVEALDKHNLHDPLSYDLYGQTYEETRDFISLPPGDIEEFEAGTWGPKIANEADILTMDKPDRIFSRYRIYENALLYLTEHFETLRPILAEIKTAYDEVFDKCEEERVERDQMKNEQIRLKEEYETRVQEIDDAGNTALTDVEGQIRSLQDHLEQQKVELDKVFETLAKTRQALKIQDEILLKCMSIHKTKKGLLDKQKGAKLRRAENKEGASTMSISGGGTAGDGPPGGHKFKELLALYEHLTDGREIRRLLNETRAKLRELYKKLVKFESEHWDF